MNKVIASLLFCDSSNMSHLVALATLFCTLKNAVFLEHSLMKPVQAVIFDMDGLLLDTESIYSAVHSEIIARFNKTYSNAMKWQISGTNFSAKFLVDSLDLNITSDSYQTEYEKLCEEKLSTLKFMPGAEKLVRHLHSHKLPLAIATGNTKRFFDVIPDYYSKFFKLFHHITTVDDPAVKNGKPAPDIFLVCMQRFQTPLQPDQVLVIEDSPQGVLGARRAGMQVVMVPDSDLPQTFRSNATKVLDSLEDFHPSEFGLPSYS